MPSRRPTGWLIGALAFAGAAGWFFTLPPPSPPAPLAAPASIATPPAVAAPAGVAPPPAPASATPRPSTPTLNALLREPSPDHATTARRLAALVVDPRRSAEERSEALAHTLNLSAGNEETVLLPLMQNPALAAAHCRTILEDALNQSATWQAEVYLAALQTRKEPALRAFIREHLAFLTNGEDLGDNPAAWREALVATLAKRSP